MRRRRSCGPPRTNCAHFNAAEYKQGALGLVILKGVPDALEEHYAEPDAHRGAGAESEDKDEYTAEGSFWVPPDASGPGLKAGAKELGDSSTEPLFRTGWLTSRSPAT